MSNTKKRAPITAGELTDAERLLLWRRRQGMNRVEAARAHNTSPSKLASWERGTDGAPRVPVGQLAPGERAFIYRRRDGHTQRELGEEIGICRWWINRMEHGEIDASRLIEHYEG